MIPSYVMKTLNMLGSKKELRKGNSIYVLLKIIKVLYIFKLFNVYTGEKKNKWNEFKKKLMVGCQENVFWREKSNLLPDN